MIASFSPERTGKEKNLAEIAKLTNQTPFDVTLDVIRRGGAQIVAFA